VAALKLLLISRKLLQDQDDDRPDDAVYRILAGFHRRGVNLLLTAPAPDAWKPTRGDPDTALALQGHIQNAVWEAGGEMDGVYYVRRSLFTQDRNRTGALNDILGRYHVKPDQAALISSSSAFLKAAGTLGIQCHHVSHEAGSKSSLLNLLKKVK
jgi:hypothetical protein